MKKALSLLMAALFLVLCLPVTALAEGENPPGAIYGNYRTGIHGQSGTSRRSRRA